jgi:hypothetical protein
MARIYNAADLKAVHLVMDEIRDIYTDTHTSPPAPEQKPGCYATCPFDDLCANDVEKIQAIEAAAAKAAREQVLEEIKKYEAAAAKAAREHVLEEIKRTRVLWE